MLAGKSLHSTSTVIRYPPLGGAGGGVHETNIVLDPTCSALKLVGAAAAAELFKPVLEL